MGEGFNDEFMHTSVVFSVSHPPMMAIHALFKPALLGSSEADGCVACPNTPVGKEVHGVTRSAMCVREIEPRGEGGGGGVKVKLVSRYLRLRRMCNAASTFDVSRSGWEGLGVSETSV